MPGVASSGSETIIDHTRFAVLADLHMGGGRWSPHPERIVLVTESITDARTMLNKWVSLHPHGQARLFNLDTLVKNCRASGVKLYNEDGSEYVDEYDD